MKRIAAVVLSVVLATTTWEGAAGAAGPYCGLRWGSTRESVATMSAGAVVDVRAGRHACFDRLVLDVDGDLDGYHVEYVPAILQDGSGDEVAVRGGARLQVTATAGVVPTDAFFVSGSELVDVAGYRTFRQVAWVGSFEGYTTVGLGVRARLPFRAFVIDGPGDRSRLVLDVAHRW